jgi:hypothetical protein
MKKKNQDAFYCYKTNGMCTLFLYTESIINMVSPEPPVQGWAGINVASLPLLY